MADDDFTLRLTGIYKELLEDGQVGVTLRTTRGNIRGILHPAGGAAGVIWVCGALGGLDGPSFGIFRDLSKELVTDGLTSLRLDYRYPGYLPECILDVLVGVQFLTHEGKESVGLVGHSFGGAVVIQAGVLRPQVRTVVGLSSQTYGAQTVGQLAPKPLLLIHGERDRNLSVECSRLIYRWAGEPKKLVTFENNGHFLRECHNELRALVRDWLMEKLATKQ